MLGPGAAFHVLPANTEQKIANYRGLQINKHNPTPTTPTQSNPGLFMKAEEVAGESPQQHEVSQQSLLESTHRPLSSSVLWFSFRIL